MKKSLIILYLIGLHLALALILWKSDFLARLSARLEPELTEHYHRMVNYHRSIDPLVSAGTIVFIGDSHLQALHTEAVASPSVNYGIGNDTTHGVLLRIPSYPSLDHAAAIVLAIGFNDLRHRSNEEILSQFAKIIDALPPDVPIILNGILPVGKKISPRWLPGPPDRITKLNRDLAALAQRERRITFLDPGPALADPGGHLKPTYHLGDEVHLSEAGKRRWIKALQTALAPHLPQ